MPATTEVSKIVLPDGTVCILKDDLARKGVASVATVQVSTDSEELFNKPIVVTNTLGDTVSETVFNSSGDAILYISSYGTYTLTVTY